MSAKSLINEPINIVTGKQGAGKTLWAIMQADLLLTSGAASAVYQVGIRDADPRYLPPLQFGVHETVANDAGVLVPRWTTLGANVVLIIDEAHTVFPQRGPGRPPGHIEAMAESRYQGVRWLLLTQAPASLDAFIRDRTNRHFHVERKLGMSVALVLEADRAFDVERDWRARKDALKHSFRYPKKYFARYTSAKQHFFKIRIPWKIWAAIAFVPCLVLVIWFVWSRMSALMSGASSMVESVQAGEAVASDQPRASNRSLPTDPVQRAVAYAAKFAPVTPALPWSAPAYDDLPIRSEPQLLCISSGQDGADNCRCFSEQVTPIQIDRASCRKIARNGIYNPHRAPFAQPDRDSDEGGKREEPSLTASRVRPSSATAGQSRGAGWDRQVGGDYYPPELTPVSSLSSGY